MADNKKLKDKELTDEQVNDVVGGYERPTEPKTPKRYLCYNCKTLKPEDSILVESFNGMKRYICYKCAGVR